MILTKQQIEEIEAAFTTEFATHEDFTNLLETVKELQTKEQRARELLEYCASALQNQESPPWAFIKKIEEHLK